MHAVLNLSTSDKFFNGGKSRPVNSVERKQDSKYTSIPYIACRYNYQTHFIFCSDIFKNVYVYTLLQSVYRLNKNANVNDSTCTCNVHAKTNAGRN